MREHFGIIVLSLVSAVYVISRVLDQLRKAKRAGQPPPYRGGLNDCGAHPIIDDKEGA
jgi:hypothetical protein